MIKVKVKLKSEMRVANGKWHVTHNDEIKASLCQTVEWNCLTLQEACSSFDLTEVESFTITNCE